MLTLGEILADLLPDGAENGGFYDAPYRLLPLRLFTQRMLALMIHQPTLQDLDRCDEVPIHLHQHVDVIPVPLATESMRQVVLRVHGRSQLYTRGTLEPKVPFDLLRRIGP